MTSEKYSLLDMVEGEVRRLVAAEFDRVIQNILDERTEAENKRAITLKIDFTPAEHRKTIGVKYQVNSKLAPLNPAATAIQIGADPETGEVGVMEITQQIPGQRNFYDNTEQGERKVIPIPPNKKEGQ